MMFAVSERKIISKLRGGLELFSLSSLEFVQGKQKKVLVEAIPVKQYSFIRQDFARLKAAFEIADLIDRTITGQEKDEHIWELLQHTFSALHQEVSPETVSNSFPQSFFATLGYHSEITQKSNAT